MFVYKITNKINGMIYIGQTIRSIEQRWLEHVALSRCTKRHGYIHSAMKKYGVDNFQISIVMRGNNIEELNHREEFAIRVFNALSPNGYNLINGGKNRAFTQEVKDKISAANRGRENTYWKGKNIPKEVCDKISRTKILKKQSVGTNNPMYGKKHTEDSIKKNCISNGSGQPFKAIKIETGETVGIWDNKAKCSRDLGIAREAVRDILKGKVKSGKGYRLEYVK